MKKKQITAAIPAVLLVLGLILAGCPQATGGGGDPVTPATLYTVTFNSNDGSPAPDSQSVASGGTVKEPNAMTKTGYEFMGWFKEAAFTNRWKFSTDTVSANITLHAKWGQPQYSVSAIESYIDAQTIAGKGGSATNPISILAKISLGSDWQNLLTAINSKDKFVELDLALCAMDGTEFDPVPSVSTGKDKIVKLVLPDAAERIVDGHYSYPSFQHFSGLTSVAGANIKEIGDYAIYNLTDLSSISFPVATSIGDGAFGYCASLSSASFPAATSIGDRAFVSCSSLSSVSFPASATLGDNPFASCTSLSSFDLTGAGDLSVTAGSKALVRNSTELIAYPSASGTVEMSSITSIGDDAFSYCAGLTSASFPDAETIGDRAFGNCSGLTTLNIPHVTSIGDSVFMQAGNTALTITMGEAAPMVGITTFINVFSEKNVTVKVPGAGISNYNSDWGDAFKGKGSGGSGMLNSYINLTVESL